MKKLSIPPVLILLALASCSHFGHLTRRYSSMEIHRNNDTIKKYIAVDAYSIEKEPETQKPKTIFDLLPQGQQALINEISKKESSSNALITAITSNLTQQTKNLTNVYDYSKCNKRIIVSIRNKGHSPADRIPKINVTLDLGSKVRILSCNKLTTEYQTLDLGKLNFKTTLNSEISGNISADVGTEAAITGQDASLKTSGKSNTGVTGKMSANRSFEEEVYLKQRMVVLNAAINNNILTLYQEGISGIDLTGNILADITIGFNDLKVFQTFTFNNLTKDGIPSEPDKVSINEKLFISPNISEDVSCKISFEADYRHVERKHRTISESDDKVSLYYGEVNNPTSNIILTESGLQPKVWKLAEYGDNNRKPLQLTDTTKTGGKELLFSSYDEANDFVKWFISKFDYTKSEMRISDKKLLIRMTSSFLKEKRIEILPNE
jgi:hypothetical protein